MRESEKRTCVDGLFSYEKKDDGTAVVTKIQTPEPVMTFPESVGGCPIAEIGTDVIPLGVRSIPREIRLPSSLKRIGTYAFNDLRYLKKLILPEGLRQIDSFGIFTCPDLLELYVPASVTVLGEHAFGYMYEHARAYKLNYFTLVCKESSAAHRFAEENGLTFRLI